jgi:ketosteroid isomerase-like protein
MNAAKIDTPRTDIPRKRLEYVFGETAKGNGQPFLDALADDAEWTIIGSTGWSKTYRGKAAILSDLIAPLRRVLAPPRKSHAHHMIAEGIWLRCRDRARTSRATAENTRTPIAGCSPFGTGRSDA